MIVGNLLLNNNITANYKNIVFNPDFNENLKGWNYWQEAKKNNNLINLVTNSHSVLISNPDSRLCGIQQNINLISGFVYRVEASARYPYNISNCFFGARLAINIPHDKEKQIIWSRPSNEWLKKELLFTNYYTGNCTLFIHMGYGKNNLSGEFKSIKMFVE